MKGKSKGQGSAYWVAYCVLRDLEYQPYAISAYAYAARFQKVRTAYAHAYAQSGWVGRGLQIPGARKNRQVHGGLQRP